MKSFKKILAYQRKIMIFTNMEYEYIDDIRIQCLAPKNDDNFDHAWKDLIACGLLEICGNQIKHSGQGIQSSILNIG